MGAKVLKYDFLDGEAPDFRCILELQDKQIGIITQGDYGNGSQSVTSHIDWIKHQNNEINSVICAITNEIYDKIVHYLKNNDKKINRTIEKTVVAINSNSSLNLKEIIANMKDVCSILLEII